MFLQHIKEVLGKVCLFLSYLFLFSVVSRVVRHLQTREVFPPIGHPIIEVDDDPPGSGGFFRGLHVSGGGSSDGFSEAWIVFGTDAFLAVVLLPVFVVVELRAVLAVVAAGAAVLCPGETRRMQRRLGDVSLRGTVTTLAADVDPIPRRIVVPNRSESARQTVAGRVATLTLGIDVRDSRLHLPSP